MNVGVKEVCSEVRPEWMKDAQQRGPLKLALVDVPRVHFNAKSKEDTYVQLPDELHH